MTSVRLASWSQPIIKHWVRVPPALAWKRPALPTQWSRVLERNPEAMNTKPLPGYVWLDAKSRRLHVWADHLEFRDELV